MAAVTGTFTATGQSASFVPTVMERNPLAGDFNITLRGTFVATVRLERSLDNGTNWDPLTANGTALYTWTAPCSETAEESEAGTLYRLNCTSYTSGTVTYRLGK